MEEKGPGVNYLNRLKRDLVDVPSIFSAYSLDAMDSAEGVGKR